MPKELHITNVGRGEFADPELVARINELEEQADRDIGSMNVNFRWGREQVAIVKRAAARFGIPYQTYLKQVVLKQAVADLQALESASASG